MRHSVLLISVLASTVLFVPAVMAQKAADPPRPIGGPSCKAIQDEIDSLNHVLAFNEQIIKIYEDIRDRPATWPKWGIEDIDKWMDEVNDRVLDEIRKKDSKARYGGKAFEDKDGKIRTEVKKSKSKFHEQVTRKREEWLAKKLQEDDDARATMSEEEYKRWLIQNEIDAYRKINQAELRKRIAELEKNLDLCSRLSRIKGDSVSFSLFWDMSKKVVKAGEHVYDHLHTFTLSVTGGETISTWEQWSRHEGKRSYYPFNGLDSWTISKKEAMQLTYHQLIEIARARSKLKFVSRR